MAEAHSRYGEVAEPQRIVGMEDRGFGLSQPVCISGTRPALWAQLVVIVQQGRFFSSSKPGSTFVAMLLGDAGYFEPVRCHVACFG